MKGLVTYAEAAAMPEAFSKILREVDSSEVCG